MNKSGETREKRVLSESPQGISKRPKVSVAAWVTSSTQNADTDALPPPTTCREACIQDRDSTFIGYVYPLHTASSTYRSALLEHLTHVVHPSIPTPQLPPQFQHVAPKRRGSTHDMYAYRVMQLKPGRSGLGGPNDFGTDEGQDDDGETWGSEKIMRVIRAMGASDVLVIVSRWYGGQLLGPVRFEHITHVARAALQKHLDLEVIHEYRVRLQKLDESICAMKNVTKCSDSYENLTLDRARRLVIARSKTLAILRRKHSKEVDTKDAQ